MPATALKLPPTPAAAKPKTVGLVNPLALLVVLGVMVPTDTLLDTPDTTMENVSVPTDAALVTPDKPTVVFCATNPAEAMPATPLNGAAMLGTVMPTDAVPATPASTMEN